MLWQKPLGIFIPKGGIKVMLRKPNFSCLHNTKERYGIISFLWRRCGNTLT
jgi:hypothetical protein